MIPRLYETNETEFTSLGIGELADATSCKVTEERNGSYELELEYPESGNLFDEITVGRIVLAKPSDTAQAQPFKIYSISKPLSGTITVNAEHVSYLLSGIPVKPFTATGINAALAGIKSNAMVDCPFTFWTDISNGTSPYSVTVPQSARACLGGTDGSILDTFGGEFEWDRWMVKSHLHRGTDSGVTIEYGKNLTDLKQDESIEELYTGCIAYWKPSSDGSVVNGNIQYIENHSNYPHERIFIYDASSDFQEAPTVDQLNTRAAKYITDNSLGTPKVNLTVSFVALWQTEEYKEIAPLERVSLCDTVHVNYPKLGVTASAKVIKTTYDTLMERYDSIELGDAKLSMADAIKQSLGVSGTVSGMVKQSSSFLEAAISTATKLLQGGLGGHVVIGTNADGKPNEILIMDTDDKATAVKALRINMNGIGFSNHGYNGPFETACTIDGKFVADFITTGTLMAGLIKTGVLQDAKGINYWNMDTGEFQLKSVKSISDYATDRSNILKEANKAAGETADEKDKALNNAIMRSLTQQEIFNRLTNNGLSNGIYLSNGDLYINGTYIKSGTIEADLIKTGNLLVGGTNMVGEIDLYNGLTHYGTIDSNGIDLNATKIGSIRYLLNPDIFSGFSMRSNADGTGANLSFDTSNILLKNNSSTTYFGYNQPYCMWTYCSANQGANTFYTGDDGASPKIALLGGEGRISARIKNRVIETTDYGNVLTYCYETPSPMFGDVGDGVIGEDGQAYIQIDPAFSETISVSQYQVFLQKYGKGECYVSDRKNTYFIVKGAPGLSFGWEIKAKQIDMDQHRLDAAITAMPIYRDETDYGSKASNHIQAINEGRKV